MMRAPFMKISLVICNKNEERSLIKAVRDAAGYVDEIVIVDAHSGNLPPFLRHQKHIRVIEDNGKGKGAAIRIGMNSVTGDITVLMDADGSHYVPDIPKLVRPILEKKADLVLASRTKGGSDELNGSIDKTLRVIGSAIITQTINSRFHACITDSQNGFRAVLTSVARKLDLHEDIFTIEQETIMKALKGGYRVVEIPSHEHAREEGVSHIHLPTMAWRYVWCLLKNII